MENETLASAVCPQCGGPLTKADENGNMKCEYCGVISLDKRHSFVHTTRDFNAELAHYLENAEELIRLGEYEKAFTKFSEIAADHSKDYRGWWGMARAISCEFTNIELSGESYRQFNNYCKDALAKAPAEKKEEMEQLVDEYNAAITKANEEIRRIYARIERGERLITLSFPLSVVVYAIFIFVYFVIYNMINNPNAGGTGEGGLLGIIIPVAVFGTAYGIWALIQDSEYAIIGIYFSAILTAGAWIGTLALLKVQLAFSDFVIMPIIFIVCLLPGYIMAKKARGY